MNLPAHKRIAVVIALLAESAMYSSSCGDEVMASRCRARIRRLKRMYDRVRQTPSD